MKITISGEPATPPKPVSIPLHSVHIAKCGWAVEPFAEPTPATPYLFSPRAAGRALLIAALDALDPAGPGPDETGPRKRPRLDDSDAPVRRVLHCSALQRDETRSVAARTGRAGAVGGRAGSALCARGCGNGEYGGLGRVTTCPCADQGTVRAETNCGGPVAGRRGVRGGAGCSA